MKQISRVSFLPVVAFVMLAIALTGVPSTLRGQSFEGVVEFTVTTDQGTMPMTYMMKGDNVRIEMEAGPGRKAAILIDGKANKTVMLMDKMKMYMEMPAPPVADSSLPKPEITKTGKSQKILDYECQQYLVKEGETASEVWITKGLGTFQMFRMAGRGRNSNAEAWQKMVGSEGGFPLLASTKNGDAEISKMMATKIEKKSLDDALFKIPDGYKRFDASMMGGPR